MPGLIDLHSDAIEKRPSLVRELFPLDFAVAQVDRRNAAAGITTPYHALSFANSEWGVRNNQTAAEVVRALRATVATAWWTTASIAATKSPTPRRWTCCGR